MKRSLGAILLTLFALLTAFPATAQINSGGATTVDARVVSEPYSVRQVSNRTGVPNQKSGSQTRSGFRIAETNYAPVTALQVCLNNWYSNSTVSGVETAAGGALTARLSIEYPEGTFKQLLFSGVATGSIADGAVGCSDLTDLGYTLPAFTRYWIKGDQQYLAGGNVLVSSWSNTADLSSGDQYQVGTVADFTLTSTPMTTVGATSLVFPAAVLGYSNRLPYCAFGDSIIAGVQDTNPNPNGGRGLVGRAIAAQSPYVNLGIPGDRATWETTNLTKRLQIMTLAGCKTAFTDIGVNDLGVSRTSAQLLTDRATIRGLVNGISVKLVETTILPTSTSIDGWKTAAGQLPSSASGFATNRLAFNQSLRNTYIPGATILDIGSIFETKPPLAGTSSFATNVMTAVTVTTGRWDVGDVITSAGVTAGTYITSLGTGLGGTGTYNLSTTPGTIATQAVTAPANEVGPIIDGNIWIPRCMVAPTADGVHPNSKCDDEASVTISNQLGNRQ